MNRKRAARKVLTGILTAAMLAAMAMTAGAGSGNVNVLPDINPNQGPTDINPNQGSISNGGEIPDGGAIGGSSSDTGDNTSNTEDTQKMEVTYSTPTTYTLSIPAKVELTDKDGNEDGNNQVKVGLSAVNTTPDEQVEISIFSGINDKHQVELAREGDSETKVVSTVTDSQNKEVAISSVVAIFQNMSTTAVGDLDGTLYFSAIEDSGSSSNIVKAGSYTGTITFKASVETRPTTETEGSDSQEEEP